MFVIDQRLALTLLPLALLVGVDCLQRDGRTRQIVVCDGGDWEISTPAGVRKPDVFVIPRETARAAIIEESPKLIPGAELYLVAEVISPGSGSER